MVSTARLFCLGDVLSSFMGDLTAMIFRSDYGSAGRIALCFAGVLAFTSFCAGGDTAGGILKGGFQPFDTPKPTTAKEWDQRKSKLRKKLWQLLGDVPPLFGLRLTTASAIPCTVTC